MMGSTSAANDFGTVAQFNVPPPPPPLLLMLSLLHAVISAVARMITKIIVFICWDVYLDKDITIA